MSTQFKYVGPYDEVEITGVGTVKRGETVEVQPPASTGLMGQDDFEHVVPKRKPRKSTTKKSTPEPDSGDATSESDGDSAASDESADSSSED